MIHTSRQLKALVRNISKGDSTKAQFIIRKYVMERFLERLSLSRYRDNLILKGGMLISAIVGSDNRSTMDIDASVKNLPLSDENVQKLVKEITDIEIDDGITFNIQSISPIMDGANYPGVRVVLDTALETMRTLLKIDFSSGDVITPHEISYQFKLLFEDRTIAIMAYNLETMLAEKIETLLTRGIANTRMRDFYDLFALEAIQSRSIDTTVLKAAFHNTSDRRGSNTIIPSMDLILDEIEISPDMKALWKQYQRKFKYASTIGWDDVMQTIRKLCSVIK
jgi:predicted nucleotidyltransferase component of viral defense system